LAKSAKIIDQSGIDGLDMKFDDRTEAVMRWLRQISMNAAVAGVLLVGAPIALAQQPDEASELNKKIIELHNAGRYSDAIPLARRLLAILEKALGRDHPNVALSLNNLAVLYESQGRYADAEPLHRRALAINEKALGRDHPDVATSLNNLAELYRNQGRNADAEPLYQRSLTIREKALGRDHPDVAGSLNNLALLYDRQGRYADAEPLHQRSLAIREKALGRDHPDVAQSMNNLAGLYESQGRYADAEPLYQRSLTILEKAFGRDHPDVATLLNNLAVNYRSQGRYADAEPLNQRSLAIWEKALGRDHPNVALSLNNLAELYRNQGRYADAEPLYQRSLTIHEKALGRDHPNLALSLNDLAALYRNQGRSADAEPLLQRSLTIREKALGRDHRDVAQSLNNLAGLYESQGRYADAEPLYQRSLVIREKALGRDHPDVAQSLSDLAGLYDTQDRYADAEPLYQRSLATYEKALGRDHPAVATLLNNLAALYGKRGRYADAEPLLQRSLAIREKAFGRDHPDVAQSLNNLASLDERQGRYADAEPLYQRSLATYEKALGRDHPDVARSLNYLADVYRSQSRYADALPIIRRTLSQGTANKIVAFPVLFASEGQNLLGAAQALAGSYEIVQRASASTAASAVSKLAARFAAGSGELAQLVRKDQDLTAEAEALDKTVIAFVSKPPAQRSAAAEEQVRTRIAEVKAEREKLQQVFNDRFPEYVALSKPQPVSLAETQALLADDEALLVFDFGTQSYAWIITRYDAGWTELKIAAKDLDAQVRALRGWIVDPRQRFDPALAYKIYQETFAAFAERIAAKKRLSVVTNGSLTSLPPQLLVTKDPSGKSLKELDWFVRSHAITVLPSVASLKILRTGSQASSARKPMIAFADPVFSKAARAQQLAMRSITSFYRGTQVDVVALGEYLPQLPETRKETQQIAAELKVEPREIRLGLDATETAVKQAKLDQYRIVYFATHGLVAGELEPFSKTKAEPALALTIPEKPNDFDDGLLTASEIAQLKLDADWAVLSACNTAAEDKPGAEALSGLARAFFYAGAKSLIVSHWSVSDEATARLMIGTFRASARDPKLSHAEAIQQAMLAMIDAAKTDYEADPWMWAPFVVVGEPAKPQ
jgi:CHAT domain-containing protein/Tfp pilus assembly protein PilF